jgi:hypothetical protein
LPKCSASAGLRLSWVEYLGDDRARLAATFKRTMAAGDVVFPAAASATRRTTIPGRPWPQRWALAWNYIPKALRNSRSASTARKSPSNAANWSPSRLASKIVPNPFNRIPGFMANEHYFVPGFPQMAHPMIEWALDTFTASFSRSWHGRKSFPADRTERLRKRAARPDGTHRRQNTRRCACSRCPRWSARSAAIWNWASKASLALVDQAMEEIRLEIERRGINWTGGPESGRVTVGVATPTATRFWPG